MNDLVIYEKQALRDMISEMNKRLDARAMAAREDRPHEWSPKDDLEVAEVAYSAVMHILPFEGVGVVLAALRAHYNKLKEETQ